MSIKKQEFYEGSALHQVICASAEVSVRLNHPFFVINDSILVLLKYSTQGRTPWGFTFSANEQTMLAEQVAGARIVLGLICGSDGVAALEYEAFQTIADARDRSVHIACYRRRGEHYEISGPNGILGNKVSPSKWRQLLSRGVDL